MSDIDFVNFGVLPNESLLEEVVTVLQETSGNLDVGDVLFSFPRNPTDLVADSFRLLWGYQKIWRPRRGPSFFQASVVDNPLQALLKSRAALEASETPLSMTALEIIKEYETYLWHREQARRFKKEQQRILKNRYRHFFDSLVQRDGRVCFLCKVRRRNLQIDHWFPMSLGGLSELSNLRLLCKACNRKKRNHVIAEISSSVLNRLTDG